MRFKESFFSTNEGCGLEQGLCCTWCSLSIRSFQLETRMRDLCRPGWKRLRSCMAGFHSCSGTSGLLPTKLLCSEMPSCSACMSAYYRIFLHTCLVSTFWSLRGAKIFQMQDTISLQGILHLKSRLNREFYRLCCWWMALLRLRLQECWPSLHSLRL